jgi:hypothetical protein
VPASDQSPLIDDLGLAPGWPPPSPRPVLSRTDLHDVQPVRPEPLGYGPLLHLPAPDQLLEPDVEIAGRPQLRPGYRALISGMNSASFSIATLVTSKVPSTGRNARRIRARE